MMKNSRPGTWKKAGKKPFTKFADRADRGSVTLHKATCNECGNMCEVPFKPNGKKPIYCRECFKRDEGDEREERPAFKKPYVSRPSFTKSFDKGGDDKTAKQLSAINAKLDTILKTLATMMPVDGIADEDEV